MHQSFRLSVLWLALLYVLPAQAQPVGRAPDFDSQDPAQWAVRRLREEAGGPLLRLWEPKNPRKDPPRTADGALLDPEGAFPDRAASAAVMANVRAFLRLDRPASDEERREAFAAVAESAEHWARFWTGEPPTGLKRREAKAWVVALQDRIIQNPAVPKFNEVVDKGMDKNSAAETGFSRGWRVRRGKAAWRLGSGETTLSIAYNGERQGSLNFEVTRLHEWVHIVDEARLGEADGDGKLVRELPEAETGLFMEAKAYAIDYLLQRSLLAGDETNLQVLADELGKPLQQVTFEEYLASELGGGGTYPWAAGMNKSDLKVRLRERAASLWSNLADKLRTLRGHEVKYLRTIDP